MKVYFEIESYTRRERIGGRLYRRVKLADGSSAFLDTVYFFPLKTPLCGEASDEFYTAQMPNREEYNRPLTKADYTPYYAKRIIKQVVPDEPETFLSEHPDYQTFVKLQEFLSKKSFLSYFWETYGEEPEFLEEKLIHDPFWFYGGYHGIGDNSTVLRKNVPIVTFALRVEEITMLLHKALSHIERSGSTFASFKEVLSLVRYYCEDEEVVPSASLLAAVLYAKPALFYFSACEDRVAFTKTKETEEGIYQSIMSLTNRRLVTVNTLSFPEYLCEEQVKAVKDIVYGNNFSILTGFPGAGKTTIIATILRNLLSGEDNAISKSQVALLAPTGRAGQVLKQSLERDFPEGGFFVGTIHKFLGYGLPAYAKIQLQQELKRYRLVVIDEASMVGVFLFYELLNSLDLSNVKLVLVGDANQLPSIEAGNVLRDLIALELPTSTLTINHRSEHSSIFENARKLLSPDFEASQLTCDSSFTFLPEDSLPTVLQTVDFTAPNVCLLSPYRKKVNANGQEQYGSTEALNLQIHEDHFHTREHCVGEKVIMEHNQYQKGYFNGDIGVIYAVTEEGYEISLHHPVTAEEKEFTFGYAITVHKSQGSEFRSVYIYLPKDMPKKLLNRELLYTAMTRAKERLVIIGDKKTVAEIVRIANVDRKTFLSTYRKP